jgi:hypothetical protein
LRRFQALARVAQQPRREPFMRSLAHSLPALPGFDSPKTYAAWPVWHDSTPADVKFHPLPKKQAVRIYHQAREFERRTRQPGRQDGALGRNGLAVLHALIFDFLNFASGRLDPGEDAIAAMANISKRSVARGKAALQRCGVLNWVKRCENFVDDAGRYCRAQLTNAYGIIQPSQWRGFTPTPEAPPPQPGTWGDHPPLPDQITLAADELRHGARRTALAMLDAGDDLARALASFARSAGFTGLPD